MSLKKIKKGSTNSERQALRRIREKQWLKTNGWRSWESLHTSLMNGKSKLVSGTIDLHHGLDNMNISDTKKSK